MHKGGNRATQIQKGVQFDSRLGSPKPRPRKQGQTKIDSSRIQGVNSGFQIRRQRVAGIHLARPTNQLLGQSRVDTPIASFVGICQCAPPDRPAKSHMIMSIRSRRQAVDRIPQTVPEGQLSKRHAQELIPARERLNLVVAPIASHTSLELLRVNRIENLNKNRSSYIHVASVSKSNRCKKQRVSVSNRSHISFDVRPSL